MAASTLAKGIAKGFTSIVSSVAKAGIENIGKTVLGNNSTTTLKILKSAKGTPLAPIRVQPPRAAKEEGQYPSRFKKYIIPKNVTLGKTRRRSKSPPKTHSNTPKKSPPKMQGGKRTRRHKRANRR